MSKNPIEHRGKHQEDVHQVIHPKLEKYQDLINKYKPVGNIVMILVDTEETKHGSIIIAQVEENDRLGTGKESGTVLAVSKQAYLDRYSAPLCKAGDQVLFVRYAGREVREFDKEGNPVKLRFISVERDDIFAVFSGKLPSQIELPKSAKEYLVDEKLEERELHARLNYENVKKNNRGNKSFSSMSSNRTKVFEKLQGK